MGVGDSGGIILEIELILKRQLYQALRRKNDLSMKGWFVEQVTKLLNKNQLSFNLEILSQEINQ